MSDPSVHETVTIRGFRPYPEYTRAEADWLDSIPRGWTELRLQRTVSACQNGIWGDEPDGDHDIPCIRVADFDRTALRVVVTNLTLRSIDPRIARSRLLSKGDLLLEKSGGGENQPVGAVMLYDHGLEAVCSNFVAKMPVAEGFVSNFLCYLHASLYSARLNTRSIKQNTGIQNLDSSSYLEEIVPIPPYNEQLTISNFLDRETAKINDLITKKERLIELLQEKRTALITQAVTKGLDLDVPMKYSGVQWLGKVPKHWEVLRIAMAVDKITNGYVGPTREILVDEGVRCSHCISRMAVSSSNGSHITLLRNGVTHTPSLS